MTRVAVVEPFFRTSGVTTYASHLLAGFRKLPGVEADFLTFTLSGKERAGDTSPLRPGGGVKSGWQWSALKADSVHRWSDAREVFAGYDLVFVNEPRCAPLDKRAMRKLGGGDIKEGRQMVRDHDLEYADLPPYIAALSESGTPWATCMHDPGYGPKLAPFLSQLLEVAPPSLVVTHRDGALESADWAVEESGIWLGAEAAGVEGHPLHTILIRHLPFAFEPSPRKEWPRVAGMTGRYINNKGQPTLLGLAAYGGLPAGWRAEVGGASPLGAGPNHTFLTFEAMTKMGFPGERQGNGNVTTGDPWAAYRPEGPLLASYDGPYADGQEYSLRHGVHVNATEAGFSGRGSLEYADLEALASGALLVLPTHRNATGQYLAHEYELSKCLNAELAPLGPEREATLQALAVALAAAAREAESRDPRGIAEENWDLALSLSDPATYAAAVLEGALA